MKIKQLEKRIKELEGKIPEVKKDSPSHMTLDSPKHDLLMDDSPEQYKKSFEVFKEEYWYKKTELKANLNKKVIRSKAKKIGLPKKAKRAKKRATHNVNIYFGNQTNNGSSNNVNVTIH